MTAPGSTLLEDRYGTRPKRAGRRTYWVVGVVALVVSGVVAWVGYENFGTAPIETQTTTFANLPGNQLKMTFEVTRDTPERPAVCIVRARVLAGNEGGRKEVYIPPAEGAVTMTTVITSSGEPVTADVFGCSYQVPAYLLKHMPPTG
ncbi:DUF4307 domain-containing protein [Actinophytocola oryzae]|uniref:Uncharacterized protein DUF4307 n=1 Tax=Actinophytocola oryzae TaxID=502181 RepID=A0A4R7VD42_9PSEU|nr:DUF4307 domain-containing protein [Actinophytocola oryzae]TDV47034.1 uncharacterized protein DUF4307 [Actinophytocola oryzae]